MSIVDHFGKRKSEVNLAAVPPPRAPTPPPAPHEKTAQAVAFVAALHDECAHLREENGRLRADLNLSLMRCRDLERGMRDMTNDMEAYRRYSVEVRTHLQHIVDCATRANEAALVAGEQQPPPPSDKTVEDAIGEVERELRDLAGDTKPAA